MLFFLPNNNIGAVILKENVQSRSSLFRHDAHYYLAIAILIFRPATQNILGVKIGSTKLWRSLSFIYLSLATMRQNSQMACLT